MKSFNRDGNLAQNLELSFREFLNEFGFNKNRNELIRQLLVLCKTLKKYNINNIYVVGSMVTEKKAPRDIDVCLDVTHFKFREFEKDYPGVFSENGLEALRLSTGVHVASLFNSYSTEDRDWYQFDRQNNFRGWVKISLFNLDTT